MKKTAKWIAAALLAAALAFVACKNIEEGGEIQQPPAPEQGSGGNGDANQGGGSGEQTPGGNGGSENLGGEEGGSDVPALEYFCEVTSVYMPNENISPKRVSEILGELRFDYTMTHLSTGAGYVGNYVSYENLPQEVMREIRFKEKAETGGVEREREYQFPEDKKEIAFEIWHGGESKFEKTVKNGNYNRTAITQKIVALLKEIIGEAEYSAISAKAASGNLTFAAQNIKALGDLFPALEKDAEAGKEASEVQNASIISQNKEAFVAQAEGAMDVWFGPVYPAWYEGSPFPFDEENAEKKYFVKYKKDFAFKGVFNLDEIQFEKADGAQGNFDEATLKGAEIRIDKLNTIRGASLPELHFDNVTDNNLYVAEAGFHSYKLYKDYSNNLGNLDIKGNLQVAINGAKDKNGNLINGYTLFEEDENTVKKSNNDTIKSLTIDALTQMYNQLGIKNFVNMIISGDAKEAADVDWTLTNIVFEGDMSKIKNTGGQSLKGIVYFKQAVYNNIDRNDEWSGQPVYGLLKLDSLEGVSYNTFGVSLGARSAVLDVRGVDETNIKNYNKDNYNSDDGFGILAGGGHAHAIYFSNDFNINTIKNNQDEINKLCYKFPKHPVYTSGFINAYLGKDRFNGETYTNGESQSVIGARNPRSLREFEYFGNNVENNNTYKFKKSAKETYTEEEFNALSDFDKANLELDLNQIAQTNKRHFCIKAKDLV